MSTVRPKFIDDAHEYQCRRGVLLAKEDEAGKANARKDHPGLLLPSASMGISSESLSTPKSRK